ncbi:hypothetical protein H6F90_29665 [Trichocoleus sp. FACHB-591]|uniref:hypothetical protein n=1 Tax=Trichocoleus sp. FACHB-591 TaxID=2692872 RepID=UPI00168772D2|nr:hypothetical protein [Trichocoleus sp. FACHB-591]MBD2099235.1 hypothetical protein [Trichocoleus sp. FACHB-591]
MKPVDRITLYRQSLEPKPSAEEIEAQKQFEAEIMMQIYADRDAERKARVERLKQQNAKARAQQGYS